ncbi:Abi family protein [Corynebacterium diphtheriae]|uniref:Abi family protein n=1 Tax=Corynebacterium diphtheriae TaxID=1717 RepID=UPI0009E56C05|nr:Abi family protein [Corynebacterium diphtheriae bv. mitis]MBG9335368.1 Abi family protein [Corynebacterium diphtheriae bv. gravis]RKW86340.1 Abi family protein [Corynebacterium diphtheriae]MBG9274887.1 Abi family protein [Corynebacterium diphtheriae bv. mitis]MBG9276084.1 Abi family protein [Corynebacterium diphtheriae bv. mitis]
MERKENDSYVQHHIKKYSDTLPVWAIVEYLSFGSLMQLLSYLKTKDKRSVANKFGIRHPKEFVTFVRAIVYLRNKCAHGSRLFNKPLKHTLKPLIFHVLG